MLVSRRVLLLSSLAAMLPPYHVFAADGGGAVAVIQGFYDALLGEMKDAKKLSFDQRFQRLAPAVAKAYNLTLMCRLSLGPEWVKLTPQQQQSVTDLFSRYTISVYASRFDDYNGERFTVDPNPTTNANGVVVATAMNKTDGEKVVLNYLLRQGAGGGWQVIDLYLSGTISQLATQRSEYTGVVQQGGADALIRLLGQRIASLRTS